jgi:dihydrofolate reductase
MPGMTTRKIVVAASMSLDGYIARPNGAIDFLVEAQGLDFAEFMARFDVCVMGRKTYEASVALGGEAMFKQGDAEYFIFSRTLPRGKRDYVTFVDEPITSFIERLRAKPGKDIWHMGGGKLVRAFLELDLIDEVGIGVVPKLIGAGLPLFPCGFPERHFKLIDAKQYGPVMGLTYERVRGTGAGSKFDA